MTMLLVLAAWMLLAVLVALLFCALARGGRGRPTDEQPAAVVLPTQRAAQDERTPTAAR